MPKDNDILMACMWLMKYYVQSGPKKVDKVRILVEKYGQESLYLLEKSLDSGDYRFYTLAACCIGDITTGRGAVIEQIITQKIVDVRIIEPP